MYTRPAEAHVLGSLAVAALLGGATSTQQMLDLGIIRYSPKVDDFVAARTKSLPDESWRVQASSLCSRLPEWEMAASKPQASTKDYAKTYFAERDLVSRTWQEHECYSS